MLQNTGNTRASINGEDTPPGADARFEKWNYGVFVVQGIVANASKRIGSARLLMPYLYAATGAPIFLAGALMPIVSGSRLIGQFISAPMVSKASTRKWLLFAGWMATAAGLAAAGLSAWMEAHWIVMVVFAAAAIAMGFAKALNAIAFNDLLAFNIRKSKRNAGIFFMSAAAGIVTIAVTWITHHLSDGSTPIDHDINLAFSAAAVSALAGLIILFFHEAKLTPTKPAREDTDEATSTTPANQRISNTETWRAIVKFSWFRKYLVMRCLTATVIVAMPFYAVHGATHHANKHAGALSAFVIATSIAVIVCGPLWKKLGDRGQHLSTALGSAVVGLAGVWAIVIHVIPALQNVLAHSLVFALAAAGIQAVNGSRMLFLIEAASKKDLAYCVAVSNTVSAIFALLLASLFGYIAELQGVIWPVILVAVLNFIASAHALTLTKPSDDVLETDDRPKA